jgi:hypothetical protein
VWEGSTPSAGVTLVALALFKLDVASKILLDRAKEGIMTICVAAMTVAGALFIGAASVGTVAGAPPVSAHELPDAGG